MLLKELCGWAIFPDERGSIVRRVQGWVVGTDGFSRTETIAIVLAFALDLAWMVWLGMVAWRIQDSDIR